MQIKLKPCPFCGTRAEIFYTGDDKLFVPMDSDKRPYYSVRCTSCFCGTGLYISMDRAIEAWNRRNNNGA